MTAPIPIPEAGATIPCTWEEFKRMAKEFHDTAPTMDLDELHNAWKGLSLGYLGMHEILWQPSAVILLKMESDLFLECENNLFWGNHMTKAAT